MNPVQQAPINENLYLPSNPAQWRQRVTDLIQELRRPDVTPIAGALYATTARGEQCACIGGIITDMAVRGGLTAKWLEADWLLPSGEYREGNAWNISRTSEYRGPDQDEDLNVPLPEACLYHGLGTQENMHHIDMCDMEPAFWRQVNRDHDAALGYDSVVTLNDRHIGTPTNPLRLYADILEQMLQHPYTGLWHSRVRQWPPPSQR